jgi:hypothetical protein
MTASQIQAILGEDNMNVIAHIPSLLYIALKKDKTVLRSDIRDIRFKFDTTNSILEVIYCRPYSQSGTEPPHGNFDTIDFYGVSTIFEYMTDENEDIIKDYYDFDGIVTLGLSDEWEDI